MNLKQNTLFTFLMSLINFNFYHQTMNSLYTSLIDSLIKTSESPPHHRTIFKQLESYLNIQFDTQLKHELLHFIKLQINNFNNEKLNNSKFLKLANEKKLQCLLNLIEYKLRIKAWLYLLYIKNTNVTFEKENIQQEIDNETHQNIHELDIIEEEEYHPIPLESIIRENISLLYRLDHNLKLYSFIPDKITFNTIQKINTKREKSMKNYKTYKDSCSNSIKSYLQRYLFNWSNDIIRIIKIDKPLSISEVVYLIFNHMKINNLSNDSTFFLNQNETNVSPQLLFKRIVSHKREKIGQIDQEGNRYIYNSANDSTTMTIVPLSDYNISQQEIDDQTTVISKQLDINTCFAKLFKSNINKRRRANQNLLT